MNKNYNLKLDLQFRCNNSIMKFNQFDNNTSDFFMRITNGGKLIDIEKAIVVLATIKPSGKVASQFVEVENGLVYADLKVNMKDEIGTYTAKAMLILEDERVVTDVISYEVEEDKIFSLLNDTVEDTEDFTLLTDMLSRLSAIETNEEQRVINEAERILSEENRKTEEAKRVEAELIRQHEEADRAKYDATRESNENIRKQNESIRLANETNRIDEEAKRVEEENKRKLAEEERNANYDFMTEDEERRRSEANAHKEAEVLRVSAENTRVNEEAKRRTTEQARVSAENTRVSNENTRKANETTRQNNETKRVEAETQRQNRYNSFILDAEANANNFENYTNTAKVKEEERKSNELDRKSQEDRRVSNEVERISNENTRKANENAREKNETSRQYVFKNKVNEVDKKIVELNTTKDNFVSNINTKVDTKISEIDNVKSDMTNTVSNKVNEVENRFNALTSKQQQDAEVIDARDGETSLKARLDRDTEQISNLNKELDRVKKLEESTVSTVTTESDFTTVEATSNGYFEDVKLEGKTLVNLWDINSIGKSGETVVKNNRITVTTTSNIYSNFFYEQKSKFKPSTEYTIIVDVYKNTLQSNDNVFITSNSGKSPASRDIFAINGGTQFIIKGGTVGRFVRKRTTISDFSEVTYSMRSFVANNSQTEGGKLELVITVLEGDHTKNSPSYFEGLKSVGDGVDEIVVSSVNENLFSFDKNKPIDLIEGYCKSIPIYSNDRVYFKGSSNNADNLSNYRNGYININCNNFAFESNTNYKISIKLDIVNNPLNAKAIYAFPRAENMFDLRLNPGTNRYEGVVPSTQYSANESLKSRLEFRIAGIEGYISEIMIQKYDAESTKYTPHQSDKKRLLYYNDETQTWEKPILREWDSIEKHADGKYYYHQRSAEVVLNGSETGWMLNTAITGGNQFVCYGLNLKAQVDSLLPVICDKFITKGQGDINCIGIFSGEGMVLNTTHTTLDELKTWIQANNVTVVYQLAQEKVYECTNIDLITYANETNYVIESGVLSPRTTLKVHSNISNVVSLLQKKVSLLESNVKASQEVQDMMILETDMRMLDIELALMEFVPITLNLGGSNMLRSATYFNFLKNHIINETYEKEYLENVMNKYLATGRINQDEYNELYKMLYPPVYDIELPIEY